MPNRLAALPPRTLIRTEMFGGKMGQEMTERGLRQLDAKAQTDPDSRALRDMLADWDPARFPELQASLRRHDALEGTRQAAQERLRTARKALSVLPESPSRSSLGQLLDYLARQIDGLVA